ncbi:MAG: GTPase ObgE [Chlamydiales bacterium]
MFTDRLIIEFKAGKGGNGTVAWRREKYIPKGGPCGGDGGQGGSIVLQADTNLSSLEIHRNRRLIKAKNGEQGGPNNRRGKNGEDILFKIPCGTLVKEIETGKVLYDFVTDKQKCTICHGGRGGKGNTFFKSPTNRAPNYSTPGKQGETCQVELELKLIADVGLVGLPNAGKSTLLGKVAGRSVKCGAYPFTTLHPNMGSVRDPREKDLLIADIPGIISGASKNKGLGFEFLRHIERTSILLFVMDASSEDPLKDFTILQNELRLYNPNLLNKPFGIALNKIDIATPPRQFSELFPDQLFEISALTGQGVGELVGFLKRKLNT